MKTKQLIKLSSSEERKPVFRTGKVARTLTTALIFIAGFAGAQVVTTLAGSTAAGAANGTEANASFNHPFGIATDSKGNIYVADADNNQIREIETTTGIVTTLAGSKIAGNLTGKGTAASFYSPTGIVCDANGNLFVTDEGNNEIRKIVIATGVVTTLAGSGKPGSADGKGNAASFNLPYGIAIDETGDLYIADYGNNEIRKIVITTGAVSTIAGSTKYGCTNGTGKSAAFYAPAGIVTDGASNLYVTDAGNNEIRKIVIASGKVSTVAGSTKYGSSDGIGSMASFNQPVGLVFDGTGDLYVSDNYNNEIRKIEIGTGQVSTLAGSLTAGSADGVSTAAEFSYPTGIAIDAIGNLYVADYGNNEIRKISSLFTSVNNINSINSLSVYPNPASQSIHLGFVSQDNVSPVALRIIDMSGKEIMNQKEIVSSENTMTVDVSNFSRGMYFVQVVMNDNSTQVEKFIKQ
jgi:serine/threonine-protein kinase